MVAVLCCKERFNLRIKTEITRWKSQKGRFKCALCSDESALPSGLIVDALSGHASFINIIHIQFTTDVNGTSLS